MVKPSLRFEDHFSHTGHMPCDDEHWSERKKETTSQKMATNHFMDMRGLSLDFYGANTGGHTFKIDNIAFKVLLDPEDGYRSCLGTMDYSDNDEDIFFCNCIAKVRIENYTQTRPCDYDKYDDELVQTGYRLVDDEDRHVWLEFGTDFHDAYYPTFVFRYYPKEPTNHE